MRARAVDRSTTHGDWQLIDGAVTRVDDVVLRPAYPWTETVHALLAHVRDAGLDCVPEPVGIRDGVEALRWIPGDSGADAWQHQRTEHAVRSAGALLRRVHEATEGFEPSEGAEWAFAATGSAAVVTHGGPGPWSFVWRDGEAVALIDWDYASPAPAGDDVAYAVEHFAPFRSDSEVEDGYGFDTPPDRAARVRAFADGYGVGGWTAIVDDVIDRQGTTITRTADLAERGHEPWASGVRAGYLDQLRTRLRWTREHRHLFT